MFERMLNRQAQLTFEEMAAYCGNGAESFVSLNAWLTEVYETAQTLAFPYGNRYGWCVAHRIGKKLVCNVFAENGAFTVMLRLDNRQFDAVYQTVSAYAQKLIDGKYPCADGGWVHFRVQNGEQLADAQKLLTAKCGPKRPA